MFLTSLPFDYAKLIGPGDRVRTPRGRATGSRFPIELDWGPE